MTASPKPVIPLPLPPVGDWTEHAACADKLDDALWFPAGQSGRPTKTAQPDTALLAELGRSLDLSNRQRALRICRSCPVIDACADHAIENGERYGIWGGLTPQQRARRRKASA